MHAPQILVSMVLHVPHIMVDTTVIVMVATTEIVVNMV